VGEALHAEERQSGDDGGRRPGVDAQDAGVGERVAGQRLPHAARQAEGPPASRPISVRGSLISCTTV
jgi:hypothetical protein